MSGLLKTQENSAKNQKVKGRRRIVRGMAAVMSEPASGRIQDPIVSAIGSRRRGVRSAVVIMKTLIVSIVKDNALGRAPQPGGQCKTT